MKTNIFTLKIISFISLTFFTLSLSGFITYAPLQFAFQVLGYVCVPLFALIILEGYKHTKSVNRYILRVFLIAVIAAVPHRYLCAAADNLFDPYLFFSAALTGFFCLGSIILYERMNSRNTRIICIVFTVVVSFFLQLEFAPHALIIMYIIHICKDKKFVELAYYITSYCAVIAIVSAFMLFMRSENTVEIKDELLQNLAILGCIPALPLIKKYDGTKGPSCKIFSYVYYLLLLAVIVSIKVLGGEY